MSRKPPLIVERRGDHLVPVDGWELEKLHGYKEGETLNAHITRQRSLPQLNLWWAGLAFAVDNFDGEMSLMHPTARKLHRTLLIACGFADVIHRIDGSALVIEDSVAFDNMEQDDFNILFEKARAKMVEWQGYDPWDAYLEMKRNGERL